MDGVYYDSKGNLLGIDAEKPVRLIDADALHKYICSSINEMTKIGVIVDGEYLWGLINEGIENAPTVEPKQGEWIEVTNGRGGHECSNCHAYAPSYMNGNEHLSDFCPNCGCAMMKGVDDEWMDSCQ